MLTKKCKNIKISNKYKDTDATKASERMLISAGVKLTQFKPTKDKIVLDFNIE